ncbi:hypothetical protein DS832_07025 [Bombilactobacillus bombi]|uniref:Uncharacterized protein n=1 Tax=Bombilactobacillus bombi TaxID=1303590 RepID=A0A3R7CKL0_9LACO|nr:hypothetical protein [Bombilactobacillus bombi]RHW46095.1 hypothetical protein DS832_07025 [Bombilactobacillus bombi]
MTKKVGRPPAINQAKLAQIKMSFMGGLTDEEACTVVDIDPATLYRYQEKHPEFVKQKKVWKNNVKAHAKYNIAKNIINNHDIKTSKWFLEHRS